MICNPTDYKEYTKTAKVVLRNVGFLGLNLALAIGYAIRWFHSIRLGIWIQNDDKVVRAMAIFNMVEYCILKIMYTLALIFMSYKIKTSLRQSSSMRDGTASFRTMPLFVIVCIIPTCNNFIYKVIQKKLFLERELLESWDFLHCVQKPKI